MSAKFDWEKYETPTSRFDWSKYEKSQEPTSLKQAAGTYGAGVAGGAGGLVPDLSSLLGVFGTLLQQGGAKGTPELTEAITKESGLKEPQNALERILRQSGEFGGQEALIGTGTSGPLGGAAGLAHGSASGAFYGGLKELGMDDEWALALTAFATVSPIAFQRLVPKLIEKFKSGKSVQEALKSVGAEAPKQPPPPPPSPPPPPKDTQFPFIGKEVPAGRKGFELAEEALQALQKPTMEKPGTSALNLPKITDGKSLAGRVSEAKEIERPGTSIIQMPKQEFQRSLEGRAKVLDEKVPDVITKDRFYNEKHGGENISGLAKREYEKEHKIVNKKYRVAEKLYQNENDIFPKLAKRVEDTLESLKQTGKPSTAEKAVIDQLEALQNVIGSSNTPIQAGLGRLVKTADTMSQLAKYEVPGGGIKNILKGFVKDLNHSVISSLESKGLNAKAIRDADMAYSKMASRFFNDEIKPFLEKTIRNPEANYRRAVSDEGTYRAILEALGKQNAKSIARLERDIVESRIRPFVKDIEKVGSDEFKSAMADLEGLIGKSSANKVKTRLLEEKSFPRPKKLEKKTSKILPERITAATKEKKASPHAVREKIPREVETKRKFEKQKVTSATTEKVSKFVHESPEKIEQMMNSRSGIRELKEELKKAGVPKLFDSLAKEKTIEILRGGRVEARVLKGEELFNELNKQKNYDILSEIYGKEAVEAALADTHKIADKKATHQMLLKLAKLGAASAGASKLFKIFEIII